MFPLPLVVIGFCCLSAAFAMEMTGDKRLTTISRVLMAATWVCMFISTLVLASFG